MFDDPILELLTGEMRYLWRGTESTLVTRHGRSTVGALDADELDAVLDDPTGWDEVRGVGWFRG